MDACLENGSSEALNADFFQIPSNSFNLQHLAFAFALHAVEYGEQCDKQRLYKITV